MRKIVLFLVFSGTVQFAFSQSQDSCRQVVQKVIDGINNHSAKELTDFLSPDFKMAGQTGSIAKLVVNQLFTQLGEKVLSYEEVANLQKGTHLELKYNIEYQKLGLREATFLFDQNNLLEELHLFQMEVKSVGKTNVQSSAKNLIQIPFEMAGNLILVDVLVNGKQKKFILDTGSPKVILNSNRIEQDSSQLTISSTQGVNGGIQGMNVERIDSLDFAGIMIVQQDVITMDLLHLEEKLGISFHGLIGFDLIQAYDILFDYERRMLTLIQSDYFDTYQEDFLSNISVIKVPLEMHGHIPVIHANIAGQDYRFGIDSGAESNLMDDDLFSSMKIHLSDFAQDHLSGADKVMKEVMKALVNRMKIGERYFEGVSTVFSDISHLNTAYELEVHGLLGYPILSKQKTLLSFQREELIFIE